MGQDRLFGFEIMLHLQIPSKVSKGNLLQFFSVCVILTVVLFAVYDFFSPIDFTLSSNQTILMPTGIRIKIEEGWFLGVFPKSGLGFKYRLQLDNTAGIIDSDYYYSDNEGHIQIKISNCSLEGKSLEVLKGQGFAQGIFTQYGITVDDDADGLRNGGFGSTT